MADREDAPSCAFITNLGKYNEGELVGKWHPFPTATEELQDYEVDIYAAVIEAGEYCNSMEDLTNLTDNLDSFDFLPGIEDDED